MSKKLFFVIVSSEDISWEVGKISSVDPNLQKILTRTTEVLPHWSTSQVSSSSHGESVDAQEVMKGLIHRVREIKIMQMNQ